MKKAISVTTLIIACFVLISPVTAASKKESFLLDKNQRFREVINAVKESGKEITDRDLRNLDGMIGSVYESSKKLANDDPLKTRYLDFVYYASAKMLELGLIEGRVDDSINELNLILDNPKNLSTYLIQKNRKKTFELLQELVVFRYKFFSDFLKRFKEAARKDDLYSEDINSAETKNDKILSLATSLLKEIWNDSKNSLGWLYDAPENQDTYSLLISIDNSFRKLVRSSKLDSYLFADKFIVALCMNGWDAFNNVQNVFVNAMKAIDTAIDFNENLLDSQRDLNRLSELAIYQFKGSGCGFSCLASGTKILTLEDGEKPIATLNEGEMILSYDPDTKKTFATRLKQKIKSKEKQPTVTLVLENGCEVNATSEHKFAVKSQEDSSITYPKVSELQVGSILYYKDDSQNLIESKLIKKELSGKFEDVYDLILESEDGDKLPYDLHNFFGNGFLVHNKMFIL